MTKLVQLKQTDLLAREPKQARGKVKVEKILAAAEDLILKHGADGFSSPMVAEAADIPVASVYQFFPTRYAILRTLAERYNGAINKALIAHFSQTQVTGWTDAISQAVDISADYSNDNPVGMAIFLNGPVRAAAVDVVTDKALDLGNQIASFISGQGYDADGQIPEGMEPVRIMMDLIQTIFAASYRADGKISDYAREEAKHIAISYLERHIG